MFGDGQTDVEKGRSQGRLFRSGHLICILIRLSGDAGGHWAGGRERVLGKVASLQTRLAG